MGHSSRLLPKTGTDAPYYLAHGRPPLLHLPLLHDLLDAGTGAPRRRQAAHIPRAPSPSLWTTSPARASPPRPRAFLRAHASTRPRPRLASSPAPLLRAPASTPPRPRPPRRSAASTPPCNLAGKAPPPLARLPLASLPRAPSRETQRGRGTEREERQRARRKKQKNSFFFKLVHFHIRFY